MNPFNPLNWLKSAQDWFKTAEKSSGFRPYLIYFLLVCGVALCLLFGFRSSPPVVDVALALLLIAGVSFVVLFAIKAFQDPNFCRSERHIERVLRLEMEMMGTEKHQLDAEVVEAQLAQDAAPDRPSIPDSEQPTGNP